MRSETNRSVYTIGYQLRSGPEIVDRLKGAGVDVLIDVRETPWSYKQDFRAAALRETLATHGIDYVHAKFAGNPKELRRKAESHEACLDLYAEHLVSAADILVKLSELLEGLWKKGRSPCLLCYERHPGDCHRSVLLSRWSSASNGTLEVIHLGTSGAPRLTDRN